MPQTDFCANSGEARKNHSITAEDAGAQELLYLVCLWRRIDAGDMRRVFDVEEDIRRGQGWALLINDS
jgi:hypothetical protein